jgi:uncharacterized protein YegJ (DUF2314 family)
MRTAKQWELQDNMVWSCEEHGSDTYFQIKNLERKKNMREFVYVWFKQKKKNEKMWVRIKDGNQIAGTGTLDNVPLILKNIKLGDLIRFSTDDTGITIGEKND